MKKPSILRPRENFHSSKSNVMVHFRRDFPIFAKEFDPQKVIYLDSAATSQKPRSVIERVVKFYEHETSNVARGNHFLSEQNSLALESVREKTASFLKATAQEIVFTQNTTEAINIVANGMHLSPQDEVIVSILEHHSNYLPWVQKAKVKIVHLTKHGTIDLDHLKSLITNKTRIIALTYASNVSGNVQPIKEAIKIAKKQNIPTLVDAAQSISHFPVDVGYLDCDFLVFSAHKMFGPSGVGVLYARSESQNLLHPMKFGGSMANKVSIENVSFHSFPHSFEAGTPNIEGILGFGAAIDYITEKGFPAISQYLQHLEKYLKSKLEQLDFIKSFPYSEHHLPIFTFFPKSSKSSLFSLTQMLSDSYRIMIRGGFHCSQLLYNEKNLPGGIRASLQIYNTKEEIDHFIDALEELKIFF